MRAPTSDLPLVLDDVSLDAGGTRLIDRASLTIAPGAPTLIVGPNGAGKTSLLRLCMGLAAPSSGRITWGGRIDCAPTRRAIVFQRPVMLRRSAAANLGFALGRRVCRGAIVRNGSRRCSIALGSPISRNGPPVGSQAASSSASRWRARSRAIRNCCCSTNRLPVSIRPRREASRRSC